MLRKKQNRELGWACVFEYLCWNLKCKMENHWSGSSYSTISIMGIVSCGFFPGGSGNWNCAGRANDTTPHLFSVVFWCGLGGNQTIGFHIVSPHYLVPGSIHCQKGGTLWRSSFYIFDNFRISESRNLLPSSILSAHCINGEIFVGYCFVSVTICKLNVTLRLSLKKVESSNKQLSF